MNAFDAEVTITFLKNVEEQAVRTAAALERVLDLMREARNKEKKDGEAD